MDNMNKSKRSYVTPALIVIGEITSLTGMFRNADYLDNSNGSDAWKTVGPVEDF